MSDAVKDDARIGVTLAGRYEIEATIGHGGMGSVYRGRHIELGEPVAIKFLLTDLARVPTLRSRFRREAVALARVRHPGVVSVLDYGEHEGDPYMVMELLQGNTVAELIDAGAMPIFRLATVFDHILQVLEVLHAHGVVHRDLKPDNVMVLHTEDGADHVKLFDFGLVYLDVKAEPRLTEAGTVGGTPVYMSPEQCRGYDVGPPSDIYSIGVTLYEALSGRPPFLAADAATIMAQHMFVDPPSLVRDDLEVTPGLDAVVRHAMEKDPERRPTARQLRDALTNALRGTDPVSLAEAAAKMRVREVSHSRSERAPTAPALEVLLAQREPAHGNVQLWVSSEERAAEIGAALVINGVDATAARSLDDLRSADVVVLSGHDGVARLEQVRGAGIVAPVLVVDVAGDPSAYARAGANDIAVTGASDGKLHSKVRRLLRRRR